ncbi:unnamed protein product, partial [marine sediment metagenome]
SENFLFSVIEHVCSNDDHIINEPKNYRMFHLSGFIGESSLQNLTQTDNLAYLSLDNTTTTTATETSSDYY